MNKAEELRKIATEFNLKKTKWLYNHCMAEIREAAYVGNYSVTIYYRVKEDVVKKLEDKGFNIEVMSDTFRGEGHVNIKW